MDSTFTQTPTRCFGTGDPLMERYHDEEWGHPVRDDVALFERIALEGFQSGLSWRIVLRKREGFRSAFLGWDIRHIATFTADDVSRLLTDPTIVRNRKKIESTVLNARALATMWEMGESLTDLVWSYAPVNPPKRRRASWQDTPSQTPESRGLAEALKAKGFVFVGPVTMYALMQACGLVDDHLACCPTPTPVLR